MINQSKIEQETQARVAATVKRLIENIPKARRIISEQGYTSLSTQLGRDWANLAYWQANGKIVFVEGEQ